LRGKQKDKRKEIENFDIPKVFDAMKHKDVIAWTTMMSTYQSLSVPSLINPKL
jgi:hypothetical protein